MTDINNETPTLIILSGILAKKFGREHKYVIHETRRVGKILSDMVEGFGDFMKDSERHGIRYAVFRGKRNLSLQELELDKTNGEVIRIVPVIAGSKQSGILQTIVGAVLIVVGVVVSALSYGWASPVGGAMISAGIGLMAGGVLQMLSPQTGGLSKSDDPENKPSYAFGGAKNTVAQGYPVPLFYGKRRVGGAIISAGIYVEDQQ